MDKDQKEIELKKLEIEKLKIKESLFRTLILIVLTAGAGLGTVFYQIKLEILKPYINMINIIISILLGIIFLSVSIVSFFLWRNIKKKLEEI